MGKPRGGGRGVISTDARGRGKRKKRTDGWEGWVSPGGGGGGVISTDARGRSKRRKRTDGWEGWVSPGGGGGGGHQYRCQG